ncbi:MAG: 16S rRNA (cytosine(1402)-N(4))-methyltransferase [Candidatus Pacebacteria bacterium RIFCSPHIGHO2_01_FULL_46_10]|nr:MAG: 16S rRNA (cytosine(1402)-N(4))-methyltransferase [Candidatus Pacebacteria bacterium RIFCSPHIGHO2_01_FULL_46_10]
MTSGHKHIPVLLNEAVDALAVKQGEWYIDATFGRGGHTQRILELGGKVIGIDHDEEAIETGKKMFAEEIAKGNLVLVRENFDKLGELADLKDKAVYGVLFDFGMNSVQLDTPERGFSFQHDTALDMRMDSRLGVTAKDLVNALGKKELYDLLTTYAQEYRARIIVDAILRYRAQKPIETTRELADLVEKAVGGREEGGRGRLHPATKTFMALRMVVNDELGNIERALPPALDLLQQGGRMVTISFQEGEDRLVKHTMRQWEADGKGEQLTKRPVTPLGEELQRNPRSRSAKLRVFAKGMKTKSSPVVGGTL